MGKAANLAAIGSIADTPLQWRNRIINGGFQINQRGSISATAAVQYGPDRWLGALLSGTSISANFTASAFGGTVTQRGAFLTGSWTGGQPYFAQRIEAANCQDLNGKTVTISGVLYQDTGSSQNMVVRLTKANALDNFSAVTTVATSSNIAVPSATNTPFVVQLSVGASDATNGLQLEIYFANAVTVTSKNVAIGDIMLQSGATQSPVFELRPIGTELALCQRYYEVVRGHLVGSAYTAGAYVGDRVYYKVTKRAAATIGTHSVQSSSNISGVSTNNSLSDGFTLFGTGTASGTLLEYVADIPASIEL